MSGTVNISRSIWKDAAFKSQPFTEREAFMWLIMEASWRGREKRVGNVVVTLERGQLAASIRFMADAWNWQKSTVDRFLKRLENRDMIGTASGTGVNVITICKYDEYQNTPNHSGTPDLTKAGQQRDSSGTNENKGLIPLIQKEGHFCSFSEFWSIWPNRVAKAPAEKAWKRLSNEDQRQAFTAIKTGWYTAWQQKNPTASGIHPATFLNAKRWLDEGVESSAAKKYKAMV